jgi:hypothetical protein
MLDDPHPAGSTGMEEAVLALTYDPRVLTVSSLDITLGSIPGLGSGWNLVSAVDQVSGQIGIDLYSTTAINSAQAGSLVNIAFHVAPGVSVSATPVQLVNSVTPNGRNFSTEVADAQGQLVLSPGMDRVAVQTGVMPVAPASAIETAVLPRGQMEGLVQGGVEETAASSPGSEARDVLGYVSDGSMAEEITHPTNPVATGALAFQTNIAAVGAQFVGASFQIGSSPLLNTLLLQDSPAQLAVNRIFLAVARWMESSAAQDNLWESANWYQVWPAVPTPITPAESKPDSSAGIPKGQAADQQAVSDDMAVVERVFVQLKQEMDTFGDVGDF